MTESTHENRKNGTQAKLYRTIARGYRTMHVKTKTERYQREAERHERAAAALEQLNHGGTNGAQGKG